MPIVLKLTTAVLLVVSCHALAQDNYAKTDDVISHFYQKGDKKDYPWHKKANGKGDTDMLDYSICYSNVVNEQPLQYLIVMCADSSELTYANSPTPTDYYVLAQTPQGFVLQATKQDSGYQFQSIIHIGQGKWAIHDASHTMNYGEEQSHDALNIVVKDKFIPVAQWTSLMDNTGAADPDDKEAAGKAERIENVLSVDDSQKDADFYPLLIHSTGFHGEKKFDEKYPITFSVDTGKYSVPDELNGDY